MKFKFNDAQLSRIQRDSLMEVLNVLQSQNENELVVTPVEFPEKLLVMLDGNVGMVLGLDAEKKAYAGLTTPSEKIVEELGIGGPEPIPEPTPEPTPDPTPTPESELDLSLVIEKSNSLARALVKLSKPLNIDQRIEVWIRFCFVLSKELRK